MAAALRCQRCHQPLFAWRLWPRKNSRRGHSIVEANLTCPACGQGYLATTAGAISTEVAGAVALLVVIAAQVGPVLWAGRLWGAPALRHLFREEYSEAVAPGLAFLAFAASIGMLAIVAVTLAGQLLSALVWRMGGYRREESADAVSHRVRVEHRGTPSLRGYRDEQVLVDGRVVGPSMPSGQLGFRGCHSWYRVREDAQDVPYYLRCWGTGRDVPHVLFRDGVLWSEKRAGGLSGAVFGGAAGGMLAEALWPLAVAAPAPVWALVTAVALGVVGGVALDPILRKRQRRALPLPSDLSPTRIEEEWAGGTVH